MGLSAGLIRPAGVRPIQFIESRDVHAAVNRVMTSAGDVPPDEIRAFMSMEEIRRLSEIDTVEMAMHGCMHLDLGKVANRTRRLLMFKRDIEAGAALFCKYGFNTDIFVYPYAFCEDGYEYIVRKTGFRETYARPGAYRIAVENLDNEHSCLEDS